MVSKISDSILELIIAVRDIHDETDPLEVLIRAHLSVTFEPGDQVVAAAIADLGVMEAFGSLPISELEDAPTVMAMRKAARHRLRIMIPGDKNYPAGFNDLDEPPVMLWTRGREDAVAALSRSVAISGHRAVTAAGLKTTQLLANGLVKHGYAVVSGATYGVEGESHRSTLLAGGTTVAILAGGVDSFWPAGHDTLLGKIVDDGAVISEMPCGFSATRWRFKQRNRLLAAATQATVITEAGYRSSSLNIAEVAKEIGRAVGAVPSPVEGTANAGCERLISEGTAAPVCDVEDVLALLAVGSTETL
jgi:DNA processing protein